jgi:ribosomal protein L16/L10AE
MGRGKNIIAFAAVIIIAFILQVVLVISDKQETPAKAAIAFSRAYFKLDIIFVIRSAKKQREMLSMNISIGPLKRPKPWALT